MSGKARPVQKPEYAEDKPEGDAHGHPGEKPHLFLMRGQFWLSPATVAFCHNALHYMPGTHPCREWVVHGRNFDCGLI
jgi:hypothetical protein